MRGFIQRNSASDDDYGQPEPAVWDALSTTPCWTWTVNGDTLHRPEVSQDSTGYRAIMPLGTDITSDDRMGKVEDRAGSQLFGVMYIDAVLRRKDHLEIRMRDHE